MKNCVSHPQIMGVLNTTPDSFYDGHKYTHRDEIRQRIDQMIEEGVHIVDVGGESTRPKTKFHLDHGHLRTPSAEEELERIMPAIEYLLELQFPVSVDTRNPKVAKEALDQGVSFINYVTESITPEMQEVLQHPQLQQLCLCHMNGTPETMQQKEFIKGDIVTYLIEWFKEEQKKVPSQQVQIYFDPGIGFGKEKPRQDLELIQHASRFHQLGVPLLYGISRKSFMGHILDLKAKDLLSPTLVYNFFLLGKGVDILRVHDVRPHRQLLKLFNSLHSVQS